MHGENRINIIIKQFLTKTIEKNSNHWAAVHIKIVFTYNK